MHGSEYPLLGSFSWRFTSPNSYSTFRDQSKWHCFQETFFKNLSPNSGPCAGVLDLPFNHGAETDCIVGGLRAVSSLRSLRSRLVNHFIPAWYVVAV